MGILISLLYFLSLAIVAVAIVFLGSSLGLSLWLIVPLALLSLHVVNGSVGYFIASWKLKRDGKRPPAFFQYVFQPRLYSFEELNRPLRAPTPVRIILSLALFFAAALLLLGGFWAVYQPEHGAQLIVGSLLLIVGAFCLTLGYRLLRSRGPRQRLIGHRGLRIVSVFTLIIAAMIAVAAFNDEYLWGAVYCVPVVLAAVLLYRASRNLEDSATPHDSDSEGTGPVGRAR